jgi:hypothetical protein
VTYPFKACKENCPKSVEHCMSRTENPMASLDEEWSAYTISPSNFLKQESTTGSREYCDVYDFHISFKISNYQQKLLANQ